MHFLPTTLADRGPQPRKQRHYFGDSGNHFTRKKPCFAPKNVFTRELTRFRTLAFPNYLMTGGWHDDVVGMMVWMLTIVRNSEVFWRNFVDHIRLDPNLMSSNLLSHFFLSLVPWCNWKWRFTNSTCTFYFWYHSRMHIWKSCGLENAYLVAGMQISCPLCHWTLRFKNCTCIFGTNKYAIWRCKIWCRWIFEVRLSDP